MFPWFTYEKALCYANWAFDAARHGGLSY